MRVQRLYLTLALVYAALWVAAAIVVVVVS
jgi:hypothetical protein